jgi:hypothetical protein
VKNYDSEANYMQVQIIISSLIREIDQRCKTLKKEFSKFSKGYNSAKFQVRVMGLGQF